MPPSAPKEPSHPKSHAQKERSIKTPKQNQGHKRLYGRAQGRPLSARQTRLVSELLPKISLPSPDLPAASPMRGLPDNKPLWLEIGFGGAEHLLHQARRHNDAHIIGIEPFLNGVAKALAGIEDDDLRNISLYHGDARPIMEAMPAACLSKIFVLFPDPWPKPRHFKRRILSEEFIALIYHLLKPGGEFRFASDIISYVDWTLERVDRFHDEHGDGFIWEPDSARDWQDPPQGWPGTRYEAKAFREGRTCHYFEFFKPA